MPAGRSSSPPTPSAQGAGRGRTALVPGIGRQRPKPARGEARPGTAGSAVSQPRPGGQGAGSRRAVPRDPQERQQATRAQKPPRGPRRRRCRAAAARRAGPRPSIRQAGRSGWESAAKNRAVTSSRSPATSTVIPALAPSRIRSWTMSSAQAKGLARIADTHVPQPHSARTSAGAWAVSAALRRRVISSESRSRTRTARRSSCRPTTAPTLGDVTAALNAPAASSRYRWDSSPQLRS